MNKKRKPITETVKELWKKDIWFKISIIATVILLVLALLLQFVIGANPLNIGDTIFEQEEELTISKGTTKVYSVHITKEDGAFAFVSRPKVELYTFKLSLNDDVNIDDIKSQAIDHEEETDSFSVWIEGPTDFSVVIITPADEDVKIKFAFKEYTKDEMSKIQLWSLGSIILKIAFIPIIIFVIVRFVIPWFKNRRAKAKSISPHSQAQITQAPPSQTEFTQTPPLGKKNFCTKCGNSSSNTNFCSKCGAKM